MLKADVCMYMTQYVCSNLSYKQIFEFTETYSELVNNLFAKYIRYILELQYMVYSRSMVRRFWTSGGSYVPVRISG